MINLKTVIFIRVTSVYNDSRAMKEILSLSKHGYHVIVLGWDRDGQALLKCQQIFDKNVEFYFYPVKLKNIGFKHIDKLLKWFMWVNQCLEKLICYSGEYIIHACDLDAGIPAYWFLKHHRRDSIKMVYDIFDYYVDSHHIPSLFKNYIENLEISIINRADITIICNEARRKQIRKSQPRHLLVIHNAPDLRNIRLPNENNRYDYAYCGSLAPVRLLEETFNAYEQNQDIHMIIAGYGIYDQLAETVAEKYPNFEYKSSLSYPEVLKIEAAAKVLSAIYDPSVTNHKYAAPNKFYESLALGKPMIVCQGTGIDQIVEEYGLGMIIPYDVDAFYTAIRKLLANSKLRNEMGRRAKRLFNEKYNWTKTEQILLDAYEKL